MENSILISTKKILGISEDYEAFDLDIITHINSTFALVNQLGVGPSTAFTVEDVNDKWSDLSLPADQLNMLKTYLYLKVRMVFDPPPTSFAIEAMNNQIAEHEHRLSYMREDLLPVPDSSDDEEAIREEIFEEVLQETWG